MPRDGSNVYHRPSGTDAVTDTAISSTAYNIFVADVETDLNTPRPVVAGGTGASNALGARAAIGAEISNQVVTNYDSQVWENGSFSSAGSATSAPVAGHKFAGVAFQFDSSNIVLLAVDLDDAIAPGATWVREKNAGVWSAWTNRNLLFVSRAGDTMTGALTLSGDPASALQAATKQYVDNTTVASAGDTMTGLLTLSGDPSTALQAATKQYVDNTTVGVGGDTMTGLLTLSGDPSTALQAATKQYTDAAAAAAVAAGAVRYDASQSLTAAQKKQANANTSIHKGLFHAHRNGVNQPISGGGSAKVQLNTEVVDAQSWFDSVTNFRFTPQEPGYYFFCGGISAGAGTSETPQAILMKNGATQAYAGIYISNVAGSLYSEVHGLIFLNGTTDFVELFLFAPTGYPGTLIGAADRTFLFGWKVGET